MVRGAQHLDAIASPDSQNAQANAMAKHSREYHSGDTPEYKFSVLNSFPKPLERQIWEGVLIRRGEVNQDVRLMNSKVDHHAPAVGKVVITRAVDDPS